MEIPNYARFDLDRCIVEFDKALRILYGEPVARRPSPAEAVAEEDLRDEVRRDAAALMRVNHCGEMCAQALYQGQALDRKSTRLNSSHGYISYAVFCLKKKKTTEHTTIYE